LPDPGETVIDASFIQTFGGKGANCAVAAARAGGDIKFVNCVGDDVYAPVMVDTYASEGMDVSLISRETGVSSGTALVMVGKAGMNYISVASGANFRLTPDRIDAVEEEFATASRIVLQCEIPMETNIRIIELAAKYGIPVQLNLAPAMEMPMESLKLVDTLIVNENEARFLMKQAGLEMVPDAELAAALQVYGSKAVIVTLGADGAVIATPEMEKHFPAYPVDVIDTTAAGDTFCGALTVALGEGKSYGEAIQFASAASAISVGRLGAIPSVPRREEIDAFIADLSPE